MVRYITGITYSILCQLAVESMTVAHKTKPLTSLLAVCHPDHHVLAPGFSAKATSAAGLCVRRMFDTHSRRAIRISAIV